jgi:hypothetical protein
MVGSQASGCRIALPRVLLFGLVSIVACFAVSVPSASALEVPDTPIAVDHAGGRVYWATFGTSASSATIMSVRLDGTDARTLNTSGATVGDVAGLAIDPAAQRVYWVNKTSGSIVPAVSYADIGGSGGKDVPGPGAGAGSQNGLAIAAGTAYWISGLHQDISLLSGLNGSNSSGGVIQMKPPPLGVVPKVDPGGGVAVDPVGKRIYWSTGFEIASANLDGSDAKLLPTPGATRLDPTDLQVDPVNGRIYWTNGAFAGQPKVFSSAAIDGSGANDIIARANQSSLHHFAIDPGGGKIYWEEGPLWSMNVDGTNAAPLLPPPPPVDTSLHAPVIDDAPPASTPLTDASLLYHAVDKGVTLDCHLDDAAPAACSGRSAYAHLAVGRHCFSASERRNGLDGPALQACWTVTQLAAGCSASFHHGYFVTAGAATLTRHAVTFHATTDGVNGRVALATTSKAPIRVAYQLDGHALSSGPRVTLAYAQLDRSRSHTLTITITSGRKRARIVRRFRYASFVAIACGGRRVVGRIAPRTVRVGGRAVTVSAQVPKDIRGTTRLRFLVTDRSHLLRAARFTFAGKKLTQHAFNAALTSQQLQAHGTQTMTIALVPKRGRSATVRITFRTTSTT